MTDNKRAQKKTRRARGPKRCPYVDLEMGRCLRPFNHTGPHCCTPRDLKEQWPILALALQDERTIVYFDSQVFTGKDHD